MSYVSSSREPIAQVCVRSQIGFVGLVEEEWVATLAMVDSTLVQVFDFVLLGRRLARLLKDEFVRSLRAACRTLERCFALASVDHLRVM